MRTITIPCVRTVDVRQVRESIDRLCAPTWVTDAPAKVTRGYNDASDVPAFVLSWVYDDADLDPSGYPTWQAAQRLGHQAITAVVDRLQVAEPAAVPPQAEPAAGGLRAFARTYGAVAVHGPTTDQHGRRVIE
jgi:hypothetical protein